VCVCVSPKINNDIIAKRNSGEDPSHYSVTGPHMLHEVVLKICKLLKCVLHVISQSESNKPKIPDSFDQTSCYTHLGCLAHFKGHIN
jgi:hypothetical protein